jgi:hypothetical protein
MSYFENAGKAKSLEEKVSSSPFYKGGLRGI